MTAPADSTARQILNRLCPVIEQHLAEARAQLKPCVVHVVDPDLMAAARCVAEAVGRLDAVKYTRGEIAARKSLEHRARALRQVLKRVSK